MLQFSFFFIANIQSTLATIPRSFESIESDTKPCKSNRTSSSFDCFPKRRNDLLSPLQAGKGVTSPRVLEQIDRCPISQRLRLRPLHLYYTIGERWPWNLRQNYGANPTLSGNSPEEGTAFCLRNSIRCIFLFFSLPLLPFCGPLRFSDFPVSLIAKPFHRFRLNLIHDYGDLNRIHLPFFSHIRRHSVDD
jgi:hypothetical protein